MNAIEIEQATRFAWPAIEEEALSYGVLRYAGGTDRRVNSLNLYADAVCDSAEVISATEGFFGMRNAAPIVRLVKANGTPLEALAAVDRALDTGGYEKQAETLTMLLNMESKSHSRARSAAEQAHSVDVSGWLRSWYELTERSMDSLGVHGAMLGKLTCPHTFHLSRDRDGEVLGSGMAVLSEHAVGLFGIATASQRRREGHGTAMLCSLLEWAYLFGARCAYLQVEASNAGAIALYRGLGFETLYSYWYRVGNKILNEGETWNEHHRD